MKIACTFKYHLLLKKLVQYIAMKTCILIFLFAITSLGQADLPDYGKLSDLNGKSKVYIVADGYARETILKRLNKEKSITVVDRANDAEMFIEYKTLLRARVTSLEIPSETGQMNVYFLRNEKKTIVWSKEGYDGFATGAAESLLKKFLKEREKTH